MPSFLLLLPSSHGYGLSRGLCYSTVQDALLKPSLKCLPLIIALRERRAKKERRRERREREESVERRERGEREEREREEEIRDDDDPRYKESATRARPQKHYLSLEQGL